MSVKVNVIKCPQCGADLSYENGRKVMYCEYCGSKIVLEDDSERTYRYVDEAKLKQAETDRMIRMKELEIQEKEKEETKSIWCIFNNLFVIEYLILKRCRINKQ